jgi:polysaccharide deacetylase family protein (PEP-CTERM system associated)
MNLNNLTNLSNSSNPTNPGTILFTVDLEDWFQVENLRPVFPTDKWDSCESRIERNTYPLLDLFDKYEISVTFFILGFVAERFPYLIEEIQSRGHEIASHGYGHRLCTDLSSRDLSDDLTRSKQLLENITGQKVVGYRAPSFSITGELIDVLANSNYLYDSSYNNFDFNGRYGKLNGQFQSKTGHCLVANNGVVEVPLSNLNLCGKNLSWSGGGFFRFYPTPLFEAGVSRILESTGTYVFYCHPWEIDPLQPRIKNTIGRVNRFRHYCNLAKTLDRIDHFLHRFRNCEFLSCREHVAKVLESNVMEHEVKITASC